MAKKAVKKRTEKTREDIDAKIAGLAFKFCFLYNKVEIDYRK